jgi:hypothetical protein
MTAYASFHAIETDRLRAHFGWVLAVLRAQSTAALSADARARREATLAELEAYAERGVFPHNVVSEEMMPAFIDERGVTCAVAELMIRSGAGELAGRVRDRMNFASIGQMLAVMPDELAAWAERAGLTPVEMAMVQPDYCSEPETCYVLTRNEPPWLPSCTDPPSCEYAKMKDDASCSLPYDDAPAEQSGRCDDGVCVEPPEPALDDDGCTVALVGLGAGSIAPLLAAVFLLTLRRRTARARPQREFAAVGEDRGGGGGPAPSASPLTPKALHDSMELGAQGWVALDPRGPRLRNGSPHAFGHDESTKDGGAVVAPRERDGYLGVSIEREHREVHGFGADLLEGDSCAGRDAVW